MPTLYSVFPINPPVSSSQLTSYKTLRLSSLQIDPKAFSSNYAREAAFSDDIWRQRLDSRFQRTFVASAPDTSTSHVPSTEQGGVDDIDVRGTSEWIGMASIVGSPDLPPFVVAPFKEAGMGANWEMYGLYAMWVHPAHRGKGVGAQLVEACLEWARTNVDVKFSSAEIREDSEKVVVLLVYVANVAGRALYSRTGFIDVESVSAREGEIWMLARV